MEIFGPLMFLAPVMIPIAIWWGIQHTREVRRAERERRDKGWPGR